MNPRTGEVINIGDLDALRLANPEKAAEFTVRLDGPAADIEQISSVVRSAHAAKKREANRRKNKAARKARRAER